MMIKMCPLKKNTLRIFKCFFLLKKKKELIFSLQGQAFAEITFIFMYYIFFSRYCLDRNTGLHSPKYGKGPHHGSVTF